MKVLSREEEELSLRVCNGTCIEKRKCKCITDLNTKSAGTRLPGLTRCVLCCRADDSKRNEYVNIEGDYVIDDREHTHRQNSFGLFIEYNPNDYTRVARGLVQTLPQPTGGELNWLKNVFIFEMRNEVSQQSPWEIIVCNNKACKLDVLSFIDKQYSRGSKNIRMDLKDGISRCEKCKVEITRLVATNKEQVIHRNKQVYSTCLRCECVTIYNPSHTFQRCKVCDKNIKDEALSNRVVCFLCHRPLTQNRRSALISYKLTNDNDDSTEEVFLCKQHNIKRNARTNVMSKRMFLSLVT